MPGKQSISCFDQVIINLVIARIDINRDDLANILWGLNACAQFALVDFLSPLSDLFGAVVRVSHLCCLLERELPSL